MHSKQLSLFKEYTLQNGTSGYFVHTVGLDK